MSAPSTVDVGAASAGEQEAVVDLVQAADLPLAGLDDVTAWFVARSGEGEVVGVAALEEHRDAGDRAFLLRSVTVRAELRGQGIGAALTRAALDHVDAAGAPVALLTETAPGYFPRFGFREVPRSTLPAALRGSAELRGACAVSARAFLRAARPPGA